MNFTGQYKKRKWQILMLQKPKQNSHMHINRNFSIFYSKRILQEFDKKGPLFFEETTLN
jgi:hypothetical protein